MAKIPKLVLDKIFDVANKVATKSIKAVTKPSGAKCELFYPKEKQLGDVANVFNDDSQAFTYSSVPDLTKVYIAVNVFNDTSKSSDRSFDVYNLENPFIISDLKDKIPTNTRVKVYRGSNFFDLKVQTHEVYPSSGAGQILYKNILVPWN